MMRHVIQTWKQNAAKKAESREREIGERVRKLTVCYYIEKGIPMFCPILDILDPWYSSLLPAVASLPHFPYFSHLLSRPLFPLFLFSLFRVDILRFLLPSFAFLPCLASSLPFTSPYLALHLPCIAFSLFFLLTLAISSHVYSCHLAFLSALFYFIYGLPFLSLLILLLSSSPYTFPFLSSLFLSNSFSSFHFLLVF